ncbi:MAG: hypothetical protein IJV85_06115 [Clostridia bacterium]|nr:hypothetical protein [Clostridia bacterium]
MMYELGKIFSAVKNGDTVVLEKDKVYDVWQDDCLELTGYFCSNTASVEENPNGYRRVALHLKDKENVTIDGNGATIMIHGIMTPILLDKCKNIVIKNLTIDYARPTMNEYSIDKKDGDRYEITINPEILYEIRDNQIYWQGEKDKNGKPLWETGYKGIDMITLYMHPETAKYEYAHMYDDDCRPSIPTIETVEELGDHRLALTFVNKNAYFPVGAVGQTRCIIRDQLGSFFRDCVNLTLENMTIYCMHGFGLLSQYCDTVTFKNLNCTPKSGRTIASNADFFHFSGCKGLITIDGCRASGAHDDFINVHGTYLRIEKADRENNSLLLLFEHPQSWGFEAFHVGDTVSFVKWDTLIDYAQATVLSAEKVDDKHIRVTLDKALPEMEEGKDVLDNLTWKSELVVTNNWFGPSSGHGFLCSGAGKRVLIENNEFINNVYGVISVACDCNFWFESGRNKEVIFRKNKVVRCGSYETRDEMPVCRVVPNVMSEKSQQYVHGTLVIENNVFLDPPKGYYDFDFNYIEKVIMRNNVFDKTYEIKQRCVGKIKEKGNKIL